jgi:AraC family ethanolamine operon transcriptional activator
MPKNIINNKSDPRAYKHLAITRFDDLDEFAMAVQAWDIDFRQLDSGQRGCDLLEIGVDKTVFSHCSIESRFLQSGTSPASGRTFSIPVRHVPVNWCGHTVNADEILLLNSNCEFEAIMSGPNFEVFNLTYAEDFLAELAIAQGIEDLSTVLGVTRSVSNVGMVQIEAIRRTLLKISYNIFHSMDVESTSLSIQALQFEIPRMLLRALTSESAKSIKPILSKRMKALKRAVEYINESQASPIRLYDLSRIAGVSDRTLEYAFKEAFGVSPNKFIRINRLNGVHRELRLANARYLRISKVANRWGFTHMGDFSRQYRILFGESPSDTRRRNTVKAVKPRLEQKNH